jgi:NADH-quinone oxidoreductase subunit L
MFRIYFGIFWGTDKTYEHTPHESPKSMTFPLLFLALMSIAAGFIPFSEFVSADNKGFEAHLNYPLAAIAIAVGLIGIALAWVFYKKENGLSDKYAKAFGVFYKWAYHKFYFDELYLFVTKTIIFKGISAPVAKFDKQVVDGTMEGIGNKTVDASENIKNMQSGKLQDYAFSFIAGVVVLAIVFIYIWTN